MGGQPGGGSVGVAEVVLAADDGHVGAQAQAEDVRAVAVARFGHQRQVNGAGGVSWGGQKLPEALSRTCPLPHLPPSPESVPKLGVTGPLPWVLSCVEVSGCSPHPVPDLLGAWISSAPSEPGSLLLGKEGTAGPRCASPTHGCR